MLTGNAQETMCVARTSLTRGQDRLCQWKYSVIQRRRQSQSIPWRKSKAGSLMATRPLTPQELQHLRDFAAQWGKIVARRAFGDQGPPLDADLFSLEQAAQAA